MCSSFSTQTMRYSVIAVLPPLLGVGTTFAEEGELFVVGDLGSEHPQDSVQLLLVVLLLNGNRMSQSSDNRLIHSFNRVAHRFPDLGGSLLTVQPREATQLVVYRDL